MAWLVELIDRLCVKSMQIEEKRLQIAIYLFKMFLDSKKRIIKQYRALVVILKKSVNMEIEVDFRPLFLGKQIDF